MNSVTTELPPEKSRVADTVQSDPQPFWRATLDMVFAPRLASASADQRADVEAAIRDRFAALALEGFCPLHLHARIVSGEVAEQP